jgi:arginine/lysine/ornithine decarboxylase
MELSDALRQSYDLHAELATQSTIVFVVGLGERPERLLRLAGDVEEAVRRLRRPGRETEPIYQPAGTPELVVSPRDAFLGDAERVPVAEAVGRVSCESIAGYPPGIPALLPGERISEEIVRYLSETVAAGGRLHGASSSAFETVHVLRER